MEMTAKDIALTVCMATMYVVLGRLPGFPVVGVEGARIGLVSTMVPVFWWALVSEPQLPFSAASSAAFCLAPAVSPG